MKHNKTRKNKQIKHTVKNKKKYIFSVEDYKSGDGMLTSVWGPSLWHTLHTISFNYPNEPTKEQKKEYKKFMKSLVTILPCKYCRENLKKNFKVLPITNTVMKNRENFSRYVYNLHELVNSMLMKKSNLTYEDVRDRYEYFRSRCSSKSKLVKKQTTTRKKEKGCTRSEYGMKTKCLIRIVPHNSTADTFKVDSKCFNDQN